MKTKFKNFDGSVYEASVETVTETLQSHGKEYMIFKMHKNKYCDKDMYYAVDKHGSANQRIELYDSVGDILFDLDWRPYFNENLLAAGFSPDNIIHIADRDDPEFMEWWNAQFSEMKKIRQLCRSGKSFAEAVDEVKKAV